MNTATTEPRTEIELTAALPEELSTFVELLGQPRYRGNQIFSWLHGRGVCDPAEMTDLPSSLRTHLADLGLAWSARAGSVLRSTDGTRKLEVQYEPNHVAPVWPSSPGRQSMMMHMDYGADDVDEVVAWAIECGATLADHQPQPDVRVLLDPEGHPFCVFPDRD